MNSILETIQHWAEKISETYKVSPYIFGLLYLCSVPFFWFSLYKIVQSIKKGEMDKIIVWAIILGIATLLPFIYVAISGKNLPAWFWIVLTGLVLFSILSLLKNIQKKLYGNGQVSQEVKTGTKVSKVLISGYYGFGNLGDDLILSVLVNCLKKLSQEIEITVLSANPAKTSKEYQVKTINRWNIFSFFKEIRKTDLFISGGGGLLQDTSSFFSPLYYLGLIFLAQIFGKQTFLYAQGIGPLKNRFNRWLTKFVLSRTGAITLRDEESKQFLVNLGIRCPFLEVTADPVFSLELPISHRTEKEKKKIGFILRKVSAAEEKVFAYAIIFFAQLVDWEVTILPFQKKEDLAVAEKIISLTREVTDPSLPDDWQAGVPLIFVAEASVPTDLNPRPLKMGGMKVGLQGTLASAATRDFRVGITLGRWETLPRFLEIFSSLDLVVSMRLHGLILGVLNKKTVIGYGQEEKISNFLTSFGLPGITPEGLTGDNLVKFILSVWQEKEKYAKIIQEKVPLYQDKAKKTTQILEKLLQ